MFVLVRADGFPWPACGCGCECGLCLFAALSTDSAAASQCSKCSSWLAMLQPSR